MNRGSRRRLTVVGAGWAGLAAAVRARDSGYQVEVLEMAPAAGGRARSVERPDGLYDNGQHILIGAYTRTLELMRRVGVDPEAVLLRRPLTLTTPQGDGLALRPGPAVPAWVRAVLAQERWSPMARLRLLATAARWRLGRFRQRPDTDVASLCAGLPVDVFDELVEPLCVAALNTPASQASAAVFLRVLRDALFAGPGAADLLLPRAPLSALFPDPARTWLATHGVTVHNGRRVSGIEADREGGWQVDGERCDAVVLAAGPLESARLARRIAPHWAARVDALRYEPIITVWLRSAGARLPGTMHRLVANDHQWPAQFVFDLGQLLVPTPGRGMSPGAAPDVPPGDLPTGRASPDGLLAFVCSGAGPWLERGLEATSQAVLQQAGTALGPWLGEAPTVVHAAAEKRATFACTVGLVRPPTRIAPGLVAAGDHLESPYPATLEAAMRSADEAIAALEQDLTRGL